ncbi:bifunctional [glutamine synthetase] adenylyltransferase/[glutamine synthetase]-adenylyl-L-tyrosine phosphorylase [Pseudoscardovia radai]|uniref:bifunctional [glutamine synthetase] adenylyltransferase/[glutamine synthetase]-adenylyl-L-tyrosine phosphorylase n=1 Tax=Pseudoscardovia radai TaxID=987066 RepID=UPI0039939B10
MKDASEISSMDLIRAGVSDAGEARAVIGRIADSGLPGEYLDALVDELQHACDPDCALRHLADLVESGHTQPGCFGDASAFRRLIRVLGASDYLGRLMETRSDILDAVTGDAYASRSWTREKRRADLLEAAGADPADANPVATLPLAEATNGMRRRYWRQMAAIAAYDVSAPDPLEVQPQVSLALSDAADAAIEAALAISRSVVDGASGCLFAVIGMGKLGARELNYMSDCDLIYAVEPAGDDAPHGDALNRLGTKIATQMQRICQDPIPGVTEPALWQIDGALRPEGKAGQLVRTVDSHRAYYEKWADNWEFQALLKARGVAGDPGVCEAYLAAMQPFVWSASARPNFVSDCQAMRRRVEDYIQPALRDREIKLGRGGLRDVEFTVQMLQLVHGRTDETLRRRATLDALKALAAGGYVSRRQAERLSRDYRFERVMEHRQQMWQFHRTHLFPDLGEASRGGLDTPRKISLPDLDRNRDLRRLARAVGMRGDQLVEAYDSTRREIRQLHLDIYYRPMLPLVAQMSDDAISLTPQAIEDRFSSLGFLDPHAAIGHVQALTEGVSRAAKINRILLPGVLEMIARGQNPDMGLLQWRRLVESFGTGSLYLGFLRDSSTALTRVCRVLPNSRFLGDALVKSSESVTWLGGEEELQPRSRASLDVRCTSALHRYAGDMAAFSASLRAMRRHEIERIGLGWINGVVSSADSLGAMTDVYDAALHAALAWSTAERLQAEGLDDAPATVAVIGMGRYGGREVNFSSDADIIVIYEPADGADPAQANAFARAVEDRTRQILMGPQTTEPPIELDLDLRPEGRNGALVRSYDSCREYYASWADTWEHQALLRARYAAGDQALAERFLHDIADPLRYPGAPLTDAELQQIRTLKARMEAERLPRGVRRDRHVKLGMGGLSDVEWTVQLLQLMHAGAHPELRTTGTMAALDALEGAGLVAGDDADVLRRTWWLCTNTRNANMLWTGRTNRADVIPDDTYALGGIAACLGRPANSGQAFADELLGLMRRCRAVTERLFYAEE